MSENKKNLVAVGLKYEEGKTPKIVAKTQGKFAEDFLKLAQDNNILVHEDKQLLQLLAQLSLGDEIPQQLYVVIAELIAFSYVIQGKFPKEWHNIHQRISEKL